MPTKTVRLDEDVYERIRKENRSDETLSETVERLIGASSLLDIAGILSDEEAAAFRKAIEEADADAKADVDELVDRFADG